MAQSLDFNVSPYYDDFEATNGAKEKNYHRILFRPGFPVQARELTQIQSILQEQVGRFGNHVFKNGSQVIPGDISLIKNLTYLKIQDTYQSLSVESYRASFLNKIITGVNSGVKARVVATVAATASDPITLIVKYISSGPTENAFLLGESFISYNADNTTTQNPSLTTSQTTEIGASLFLTEDTTGTPSMVKIVEGVYYINGFFVANSTQELILEKYTSKASYRVGFNISETTVSPEQDVTLKDNAIGSTNESAPGGHRFKIEITLVKLPLTSTADKNFIELLRIDNGTIVKQVEKSDYDVLEKNLARRTFDESGNYEVRKFKYHVREHLNNGSNDGVYSADNGGDESLIAVAIEPGKAYVQGYEIESKATKYLPIKKARDFVRVQDKPINTPIGNYVIVTNLCGAPAFETFTEVNIRDTLTVTRGTGAGNIVGTCKIRAIQLDDGNYSLTTGTGNAGQKTHFKLSIFDIRMNPGKTFAKHAKQFHAASTSFTADIFPTLTKILGTSITATNSSASVTGVDTRFLSDLSAGDVVYLDNTLIGAVSTITNDKTLTLAANFTSTITGKPYVFRAILHEPQHDVLIFPLNFKRVRKIRGSSPTQLDGIKSTAYTLRRRFDPQTSAAGQVQFTVSGIDETFESVLDLSNYTLIVTNANAGSTLSTNDVVPIISTDLVLSGANRTLTISNLTTRGVSNGSQLRLIASVRASGNDATEKQKLLQTNAVRDVTVANEAGASRIYVGKADGYRLVSVMMATGFGAYNSAGATNVTDRFDFDTGQKDAYYDVASITLKAGNPVPTGSLRITFDYFTHTAGDYFSVDSYIGSVAYENIPTYKSVGNSSASFALRDCLDFRPRADDRTTGESPTFTVSTQTIELPKIGENVEADFSYYLNRIDKVYMDSLGSTIVLEGVPELNPVPPKDPKEGMVMFEVVVPAYTLGPSEVLVKSVDNKRYTMRDIGRLERRIQSLETYTALNLLEKATADLQVKDADGFDRYKSGFIVDPFKGHDVGDVLDKDYRCAIDSQSQELRPMHFTDSIRLVEKHSTDLLRSNAYYKRTGDLITLPYTETALISNPYATRSIDIASAMTGGYLGKVKLIPDGDDWKDTDRRPDLIVQDYTGFDAIKYMAEKLGVTGTVWNAWQTQWTGAPVVTSSVNWQAGWDIFNTTTTSQQIGQIQTGTQTTLTTTDTTQNLGDRIVDFGVIPYIRSRPMTFIAHSFKPETRYYCFFDSEFVEAYVRPADVFTVTSGSRANFEFNDFPAVGGAESDAARTYAGNTQPAFGFGDVVSNDFHTPTNISAVTLSAGVASITVASATGIRVGHHVTPSNIGGSTSLNGNTYKVVEISGSIVRIKNLDNTNISTLGGAYTSGGTLKRLTATAVVAFQGATETPTTLPVNIHLINIKNAFAINDSITGSSKNINDVVNSCTITGINGVTNSATVPTLKQNGDSLYTDSQGAVVGVFFIPNTDTIRFRTGDRLFTLSENETNSRTDFDSIGEETYRAVGIRESRERTIMSTKEPKFDITTVTRTQTITRVNTQTTFIANVQPPQGDGGSTDPLAQSFLIADKPDGCFVTSVDLFFKDKGKTPVTVDIRTMENGVPTSKILPFSQKTLPTTQLNVSNDATVHTRFTFDSPVHLMNGEEYAIVLQTGDLGNRVFVSELGSPTLDGNRIISRQPLLGSLFLSQNTKSYQIDGTLDLKFNLNIAQFDTDHTSTIEFNNTPTPIARLDANPFEITTGTNKVRVFHKNHGLPNGSTVTISGVLEGNYGANTVNQGIPHTSLNGTFNISNAELDSYVIEVNNGSIIGTSSILVKGYFGGIGITATQNRSADVVQVNSPDITFGNTTLSYALKMYDSTYTASEYINVIPGTNAKLTKRHTIASTENETTSLSGNKSVSLIATLATNNADVSPVIDASRMSLYAVSNRITDASYNSITVPQIDLRTVLTDSTQLQFVAPANGVDGHIQSTDATTMLALLTLDRGKYLTVSGQTTAANNGIFEIREVRNNISSVQVFLEDTSFVNTAAGDTTTLVVGERYIEDCAPHGGFNEANYVTRKFNIENPATSLKIIFNANQPNGSEIRVYYKILPAGSSQSFEDIYNAPEREGLLVDVDPGIQANESEFIERTYTVDNLPAFTAVQIKISMRSNNPVNVPRIKALRVIALAT